MSCEVVVIVMRVFVYVVCIRCCKDLDYLLGIDLLDADDRTAVLRLQSLCGRVSVMQLSTCLVS